MHALRDSAVFMLVDWKDVLSIEERECASLFPNIIFIIIRVLSAQLVIYNVDQILFLLIIHTFLSLRGMP